MSRWFRFYDDAINDPKILKLSDNLFRVWVGILCAASKNDGQLPVIDDLALMIRIKPEKMRAALEALAKAGLIDTDGVISSPHNWNGRQYKSDVSTERVKRFRNAKRNVSETPPDTEQIQRQKDTVAKATGASPPTRGVISEADVYRIGKDLLGKSSGGVITSLRKHCRQDLLAVYDLLEQSRDKAEPMEWLQGVLRGTETGRTPNHILFPPDVYRNVL